MCVCRARDTYVKDRLARPVLRLEGVVFRPKVSRALRESLQPTPRLPRGYPEATPRLPRGCPEVALSDALLDRVASG